MRTEIDGIHQQHPEGDGPRRRSLADRLFDLIDPIPGVIIPSAEGHSSYRGFTDTPEGRSARQWTDDEIERMRKEQEL